MNLLLTGQHVDISPAIRAYVEDKLERIFRHFDQIIDVTIVLGIEQPSDKDKRQRAEANLRLKGTILHVEHFAVDIYAAVDGMIEKLDRQLLKHKGKVQSHKNASVKYVVGDRDAM